MLIIIRSIINDTGFVVSTVKDAVAAMVVAIPEITIKDEEDAFDARVGNEEYKKIRVHLTSLRRIAGRCASSEK